MHSWQQKEKLLKSIWLKWKTTDKRTAIMKTSNLSLSTNFNKNLTTHAWIFYLTCTEITFLWNGPAQRSLMHRLNHYQHVFLNVPYNMGSKSHRQDKRTLAMKLSKMLNYFHVSHSFFLFANIISDTCAVYEIFSFWSDLR